jgi:hypothetical protein
MAEGLSSLLVWAELDGRVTGVPIAAGGIRISHLLFANDSLFFFFSRAIFSEWGNLSRQLHSYKIALAKSLMEHKPLFFFSLNTREEFKSFICTSAGISSSSCYEKYLRLLAFVGRSKLKHSPGSKARFVENWMGGRKNSFLWQGGRFSLKQWSRQFLHTV